MIFIVVKFIVKPDWTDRWLDLTRDFTKAMQDMPQALAETPQIISEKLEASGWGRMGELTVP